MQTPAFLNAPIAIPSWRASSRQRPCWLSGSNRQKTKHGLESKQQAASVLAEWIQPAEDEAWAREQKQMNTESAG